MVRFEFLIQTGYSLFDFRIHADVYVACIRIFHLVYLDYGIEKLVYSPSRRCYRRHERDSEHFTEGFVIELSVSFLQLVIHVEVDHHRQVHVYELRGQIQVAFQI